MDRRRKARVAGKPRRRTAEFGDAGGGTRTRTPLGGTPAFKAARSVPPYVARCRDAPSGAGSRRTGPVLMCSVSSFPTRRPPVNFGERMGMEDGRSIDTARHAGRASATASTRPARATAGTVGCTFPHFPQIAAFSGHGSASLKPRAPTRPRGPVRGQKVQERPEKGHDGPLEGETSKSGPAGPACAGRCTGVGSSSICRAGVAREPAPPQASNYRRHQPGLSERQARPSAPPQRCRTRAALTGSELGEGALPQADKPAERPVGTRR